MENIYHIDDEDFGDLISQIENSFGFEFDYEEITNNMTIENFSELVISKMSMENGQECSTQIVFYRIRKALTEKLGIEKSIINTKTELSSVFAKKNRINNWKNTFGLFNYNGINLQPSSIPYGISILTTIVSFFFFFGSYRIYAISIFILSIITAKILVKYGKRFPAKNIGDLAKVIVINNYKSVRTEKGTINISEIKKLIFIQLTDWLEPKEVKNMNMETKINYID
jgi:acyl carrier protein|tara:strand:- start:123 stop:803 length:681 start_codon:yes stop_codon:yes gene_type:complete